MFCLEKNILSLDLFESYPNESLLTLLAKPLLVVGLSLEGAALFDPEVEEVIFLLNSKKYYTL